MLKHYEAYAPLKRNVTTEELAPPAYSSPPMVPCRNHRLAFMWTVAFRLWDVSRHIAPSTPSVNGSDSRSCSSLKFGAAQELRITRRVFSGSKKACYTPSFRPALALSHQVA
jgi:hypothetical protein